MTELTLEELAEGEAVLAECPDHEAITVLAYFYRHRKALLAMARELIRIRSAIECCAKGTGGRFSAQCRRADRNGKDVQVAGPNSTSAQ